MTHNSTARGVIKALMGKNKQKKKKSIQTNEKFGLDTNINVYVFFFFHLLISVVNSLSPIPTREKLKDRLFIGKSLNGQKKTLHGRQ